MTTMTSIVKAASVSSHIAMEMALYEEDKILIAEDLADKLASEVTNERVRQLDMGQGVYLGDINPIYFVESEEVELPLEITEGFMEEWGVDVYGIKVEAIQFDFSQMTRQLLSLDLENQMSDIDEIGEQTFIDVRAGKVFALQDLEGISVYVSKGGYVGDKTLQALKISEDVLGTKMQFVKDCFKEQDKALLEIYEPAH